MWLFARYLALDIALRLCLAPLSRATLRMIVLGAASALAALILVLVVVAFAPYFATATADFLDTIIFGKLNSESGIARMNWNRQAITVFLDTYMLGVGIGGSVASSMPLVILSNLGLAGMVLFLAVLGAALFGRPAPGTDRRVSAVIMAARAALLMKLIAMSVSQRVFGPGLPFYVFLALSVAEHAVTVARPKWAHPRRWRRALHSGTGKLPAFAVGGAAFGEPAHGFDERGGHAEQPRDRVNKMRRSIGDRTWHLTRYHHCRSLNGSSSAASIGGGKSAPSTSRLRRSIRGLNVFEGLKGYWQADGSFGIVAVERHWSRLKRSAKLLHIPFDMSLDEFEDACHGLVQLLYRREQNMWIRATLYVTDGHWGVGTKSDLVLTAYHTPKGLQEPMATGVSTWQRATDVALPYRIKTSSNYQVARLAKIEGRDRGYPEMILLNQHGRVAEGHRKCCRNRARWSGAHAAELGGRLREHHGRHRRVALRDDGDTFRPPAHRPHRADHCGRNGDREHAERGHADHGPRRNSIWRLARLQRPRPAISTRRDRGAAASPRGAIVPPAVPRMPAPPTAPPMPAVDSGAKSR